MNAAVALCSALAFGLAGCGGNGTGGMPAARGSTRADSRKDLTSGGALERFFPLVDGMIYSYTTENDLGERGILIARVARTSEKSGELRFPTGKKVFSFELDSVLVESVAGRAHLLKEPLQIGATFRGEHGGVTRIESISAAVDVPAGHFSGCVQTIEERSGDRPARYETTFCPEVGVVALEAASGKRFERATLKSYGAPVEMKPDGVERFQVTPSPVAPGPGARP